MFYSRSEYTPEGGRATPYSDSGYAVERTELRSTAQLDHLYGSRSGTLRLGSLRCRAYLAELYSIARRAVRDSPLSSTEYHHLPCGIAHLPVRKQSQGYVVPDAFAHGTSSQRMYWFKRGFETGDFSAGDTFAELK
ncbi:neutral zinc metallopeptidase [Porphyromonas gingivalis]|uniref:neutral zinc metallopeptidase n=1 Tax=Porphyromonas gingivalis TaxID=837 RepID=UPI001F1DF7F9|nr:neutral zinc metallopeptidase [Porphyromonas gingivalis]